MIPPSIIRLRIYEEGKRRFGLWFPLVILWPIIVVLPLALLPVIVIVELALHATRYRAPLTRMVFAYLHILSCLKGLKVHVQGKDSKSLTHIALI